MQVGKQHSQKTSLHPVPGWPQVQAGARTPPKSEKPPGKDTVQEQVHGHDDLESQEQPEIDQLVHGSVTWDQTFTFCVASLDDMIVLQMWDKDPLRIELIGEARLGTVGQLLIAHPGMTSGYVGLSQELKNRYAHKHTQARTQACTLAYEKTNRSKLPMPDDEMWSPSTPTSPTTPTLPSTPLKAAEKSSPVVYAHHKRSTLLKVDTLLGRQAGDSIGADNYSGSPMSYEGSIIQVSGTPLSYQESMQVSK